MSTNKNTPVVSILTPTPASTTTDFTTSTKRKAVPARSASIAVPAGGNMRRASVVGFGGKLGVSSNAVFEALARAGRMQKGCRRLSLESVSDMTSEQKSAGSDSDSDSDSSSESSESSGERSPTRTSIDSSHNSPADTKMLMPTPLLRPRRSGSITNSATLSEDLKQVRRKLSNSGVCEVTNHDSTRTMERRDSALQYRKRGEAQQTTRRGPCRARTMRSGTLTDQLNDIKERISLSGVLPSDYDDSEGNTGTDPSRRGSTFACVGEAVIPDTNNLAVARHHSKQRQQNRHSASRLSRKTLPVPSKQVSNASNGSDISERVSITSNVSSARTSVEVKKGGRRRFRTQLSSFGKLLARAISTSQCR